MYRRHQDVTVCYVYLADVPNIVDPHTQKERFRQSRWFTRGWTLQELIAPEAVEFYGSQWRSQGQEASLGTKLSLQDEIFETTRIPIEVLQGSDLKSYGIAQKMSWASQRKTTRMEDRAYSLLGLFNVNMPLLYGEGNRAFIRLQEEIMKMSTDESLFAWSMGRCGYFGQGLLAMSPDYFANSGGIKRVSHVPRTTPFTVTNKGLRLEVILLKASDVYETSILERQYAHLNQIQVAVLNCCQYSQERLLGIHLGCFKYGEEEGTFVRIGSGELVIVDPATYQLLKHDARTIFIRLAGSPHTRPQARQYKYETMCLPVWLKVLPNNFHLTEFWPTDLWQKVRDEIWIPDLGSGMNPVNMGAALLFDNGIVAFVVGFGWFFGKPWVQVQDRSPSAWLGESFELPNRQYLDKASDRAIHNLSSGEGVSVLFRPQRVNGRVGYAIWISVYDIHSRGGGDNRSQILESS
jgi:hypothetical protein